MAYDHIHYFDYELPEQLIAQYPLSDRAASRLFSITVANQSFEHRYFNDIAELFHPNDLLVINNTKVFPARLYGRKRSGGQVECLIERILSQNDALVQLKSNKPPNTGTQLLFQNILSATMIERKGDLFLLEFDCDDLFEVLEDLGHIPLPPYIKRADKQEDKARYQTIYAKHRGAVAAPTAGLHFTPLLMETLQKKGVAMSEVLLHVGAGTFQPLRVEQLDAHRMHSEYIEVSAATCDAIRQCHQRGGRVIAVGTTTLRALETASKNGDMVPFQGDTDLFIRPGYTFHCVDSLITNFHLPKSTLLMLVTAFGGYDLIMRAYANAVSEQYRFYSYGDAMLIVR